MTVRSTLSAALARLGPSRRIERVAGDMSAAIVLTPATGYVNVPAAAIELARRGVALLQAKRSLEAMIDQGRSVVVVPPSTMSGRSTRPCAPWAFARRDRHHDRALRDRGDARGRGDVVRGR